MLFRSIYRRIEVLLVESGYLLPLFHDIDYRVANARVRRLNLLSTPPYVNYSYLGKLERAPTGAVRKETGGTIHVPVTGQIDNLDPSLAALTVQTEVLPAVFETLTGEAEGARIVPWLASEFHAEEGGKRFRFRLREDVRFHDGRRMNSRDVRYSFEHLLFNRESRSRWLLSPVGGAKELLNGAANDLQGFHIHSPSEFTIELDHPISFFPALLAYPAAAIVPEGTYQFCRKLARGMCRNGSFSRGAV